MLAPWRAGIKRARLIKRLLMSQKRAARDAARGEGERAAAARRAAADGGGEVRWWAGAGGSGGKTRTWPLATWCGGGGWGGWRGGVGWWASGGRGVGQRGERRTRTWPLATWCGGGGRVGSNGKHDKTLAMSACQTWPGGGAAGGPGRRRGGVGRRPSAGRGGWAEGACRRTRTWPLATWCGGGSRVGSNGKTRQRPYAYGAPAGRWSRGSRGGDRRGDGGGGCGDGGGRGVGAAGERAGGWPGGGGRARRSGRQGRGGKRRFRDSTHEQ